jgi:predicted HicB family RNase H-like nuclease
VTEKIKTAGGDEPSEEDVEALADEAERGYGLTKAKRVTVGRPSLGSAGASPRVQVRVDPDLAEALQARAQKERRSVSEIARTALRQYVEHPA